MKDANLAFVTQEHKLIYKQVLALVPSQFDAGLWGTVGGCIVGSSYADNPLDLCFATADHSV